MISRFTPHSSVLRFLVVASMAAFGTMSCRGSNPVQPTPSGPALSCPADLTLELIDTPTVPLHYPAPTVTGGAAPVTVTCTPPSGASELGPGQSTVTCTASDSNQRTAECSFGVTVNVVPRLRGTKIVTFGDSITWGEISAPVPIEGASLRYQDPAVAYPTQLRELLRERYTAQADAIQVINEGVPGEQVIHTLPGQGGQTGEGRMEYVADHHEPDVMIVLEGVNGLTYPKANDISEGLRRGVRRVRRLGTPLVIVSTVLPGVDGRPKRPDDAAVRRLNAEIKEWVGAEGAVLVDAYAAFDADRSILIGQDGLHPTPAGYTRLAELFFATIQARFELPPPTAAPASLPGFFPSLISGPAATAEFTSATGPRVTIDSARTGRTRGGRQ
jgi:lysophospholipase L1-like esterase